MTGWRRFGGYPLSGQSRQVAAGVELLHALLYHLVESTVDADPVGSSTRIVAILIGAGWGAPPRQIIFVLLVRFLGSLPNVDRLEPGESEG